MNQNKAILVVVDDAIDRMTILRAFKQIKITNEIFTVTNGEEALAFLKDPQNPKPCLILLDLNMPKMNGLEFLKQRMSDQKILSIPVIILTTSQEEKDKVDSLNYSISGYMVKPVDYLQFVELISTINLYWTLSEFPD